MTGNGTDAWTASLRGRAYIVTGAARGLGRAYAAMLLAAGARVVLNDVDADALARTAAELGDDADRIATSNASVTDSATGEALVDLCGRRWGRVDGLVNNAGIAYLATVADDTPARQRELIEVNLLGALWCGSAVLRRLLEQGSGAIVNITSGAALGGRGLAAYASSKAAILGLTYSWAVEVEGTGVRVNALSPVAVTRMSVDPSGPPPERIAPVVGWLLSDASADLNGQVIRFDGQRLGLIAPPGPVPVTTLAPDWSPTDLEAALHGLRARRTPVGAAAIVTDYAG
jgi:NAD(P)-dependent dehydrogenase (short-subunit alcohol dehydrogenase family)